MVRFRALVDLMWNDPGVIYDLKLIFVKIYHVFPISTNQELQFSFGFVSGLLNIGQSASRTHLVKTYSLCELFVSEQFLL